MARRTVAAIASTLSGFAVSTPRRLYRPTLLVTKAGLGGAAVAMFPPGMDGMVPLRARPSCPAGAMALYTVLPLCVALFATAAIRTLRRAAVGVPAAG
ncbi:hypothetical protein [Streptomyces sp. NPDC051561]|uniref:hypothetical protein n=1 Tax=Streptomyces sp. NPDC051561 TaxID=3365658 RepID=UPI0037B4A7DA